MYQQSLTGISCHQKRPLGFLPIVSSHDLSKKELSCDIGLSTSSTHTKIQTNSDDVEKRHVDPGANDDELAKKLSPLTNNTITSNPREVDIAETVKVSGANLQPEKPSAEKRGPQSAGGVVAQSAESDVCKNSNSSFPHLSN